MGLKNWDGESDKILFPYGTCINVAIDISIHFLYFMNHLF